MDGCIRRGYKGSLRLREGGRRGGRERSKVLRERKRHVDEVKGV